LQDCRSRFEHIINERIIALSGRINNLIELGLFNFSWERNEEIKECKEVKLGDT